MCSYRPSLATLKHQRTLGWNLPTPQKMEFADSTKKALATEGYDLAFGARPLKRVIQNRKLNALAKNIIDGSIKQESEVIVKYDNNKYSFDTKQRVTLW